MVRIPDDAPDHVTVEQESWFLQKKITTGTGITGFRKIPEGKYNLDYMLRMNENTFTFLSPVAEKLHQDISNSSLSNLKMHTQNTIQAS